MTERTIPANQSSDPDHAAWHALATDATLAALDSDDSGLSNDEAEARLKRVGPNQLTAAPPVSPFKILLDEFRSPLILILIGAALVLFVVAFLDEGSEQIIDAILIMGIVLFNGALGFVQNYRAQRGIEALARLASPTATVLRGDRHLTADAATIVPGDIILLEEGDRVPADGRLIQAYDLSLDESALTGESLAVAKGSTILPDDTVLAERGNMAYMGTTTLRGRGRFAVTETGMSTEVGRIAQEIQIAELGETRFQRQLASMSKRLTLIIGVLVLVIAALQLTIGNASLLETFIAAVALAVAAIPEGLPVVLTLALAFGTRRMLERNTLVRSLPTVEILGSAQVICTDKTGTITEGRMSLRSLYWHGSNLQVTGEAMSTEGDFLSEGEPKDQSDNLAMLAGLLCNNAHRDPEMGFLGDPTEVALLVGAHKANVDADGYTRVDEIPFSSERKMMSVVVERDGERSVFSKGAPEIILLRCHAIHTPNGIVPLDDNRRGAIMRSIEGLAGRALRVLALAYKDDESVGGAEREEGLVFLGLAGISDPPRLEAKDAMEAAKTAGIRVVMITGDNRTTATAIGHDVGIEGECLEGRDLDGLNDGQLDEAVRHVSIYARAEPGHKLRILRALQGQDNVVVMTGDGVNDAPALKGSDVGIAMGLRGTDVARDASDVVLLDDNFATIVSGIEEGRRIFANIKRFVTYLLIGNFGEVMVLLVASLFGYLPVTAVQILWINFVTDSGPAVAIGIDPAKPDIMRQPPFPSDVLSKTMLGLILSVGTVMTAIILSTFFLGLYLWDLETARTLTFTAFVVQEYVKIAVLRFHEKMSLFANRWLVLAILVSLMLQIVLIYTPAGGPFDVVALGLTEWSVLLGGLVVSFIVSSIVMRLVTRRLGAL